MDVARFKCARCAPLCSGDTRRPSRVCRTDLLLCLPQQPPAFRRLTQHGMLTNARYPPYWVKLPDLWESMTRLDPVTGAL